MSSKIEQLIETTIRGYFRQYEKSENILIHEAIKNITISFYERMGLRQNPDLPIKWITNRHIQKTGNIWNCCKVFGTDYISRLHCSECIISFKINSDSICCVIGYCTQNKLKNNEEFLGEKGNKEISLGLVIRGETSDYYLSDKNHFRETIMNRLQTAPAKNDVYGFHYNFDKDMISITQNNKHSTTISLNKVNGFYPVVGLIRQNDEIEIVDFELK
eukprot:233220_1